MTYRTVHNRVFLALSAVALLAITGCRAEEQDRVTFYEPGVYQGQQDAELKDETLDTLRARAMLQKSP